MFLLTDGQINDNEAVINCIRSYCSDGDSTKVFSFGVSSGCDQDLIRRTAAAGQGSESILMDEDLCLLREHVIKALRRACAPALQGCTFNFGNQLQHKFLNGDIKMEAIRILGTLY